jgi:MoaA/NifB/PqqE/SkfB family radical SAM enzyme
MAANILKGTKIVKDVLNNLDPKMTRAFLPWALRHPRYLPAFVNLTRSYVHTTKLRKQAQSQGLMVPPFLILSITSRCNLRCAGCYADAAGTINNGKTIQHLNNKQWGKIISDASDLGVFCFIIAGGEPFLFPGLLELCREFQERFFIIFTNGTALKEADFALLKRLTNVSIIVSIEGGQDFTDERRGDGVYEEAVNTLQRLGKIGVLSGISVTINRLNYKYWMDSAMLDDFVKQGVRLGFFIEYIPTAPGSADAHQPSSCCPANPNEDSMSSASAADDHALMLSRDERELFRAHVLQYRASNPLYLIHSPGDEEFFGGCVSAGRGFAHVTPTGDLTPCPVSNVATHNLGSSTLSQGLASPLFRLIRENEHLLETEDSPCGLFAHPKEVDELARAVGAYRTNCK